MRTLAIMLTLAVFAVAPGLARAQGATTAAEPVKKFSEADRLEIEAIIKEYLTSKHPEVLMLAMQELQKREQSNAEVKSKEAISSSKDKLMNDPTSPVGGNPKGDVTVVEFFDYQCGYCKMAEEAVEKLLNEDKNIKFVYKEFPILGPMSTESTKAALAAVKQGKYIKFHETLMRNKDRLDSDGLYKLAKEAGLDVEKLKKDMAGDDVAKIVEANLKLGNDIGVRGTPMFIIGEESFPGALPLDQLKKAVADARAAAKK